MGIKIRDIVVSRGISLDELKGKVLAVDSFNILYQFLTTIRQPDGSPLTDSEGNVTSHLIGLFSRTANLLQKGIRPVFVFDGKPPALKQAERERRKGQKLKAEEEYRQAAAEGDLADMKKFASRTARVTPEIVKSAKELIDALGLPVVDAPSEGEAQAAHMVKKGDAFATASQDFDTLLSGSPRLVRNLSVTGRRKLGGKAAYSPAGPEMILLSETLNHLGIDNDGLIALSMLVGTDYNIGGIKGLGQKKALALVKKHGKDFDALFSEAGWGGVFDVPWAEVYYTIKKMPVTDDYKLSWSNADGGRVAELLCKEHGFSPERVAETLGRLKESQKTGNQRGLGEFF